MKNINTLNFKSQFDSYIINIMYYLLIGMLFILFNDKITELFNCIFSIIYTIINFIVEIDITYFILITEKITLFVIIFKVIKLIYSLFTLNNLHRYNKVSGFLGKLENIIFKLEKFSNAINIIVKIKNILYKILITVNILMFLYNFIHSNLTFLDLLQFSLFVFSAIKCINIIFFSSKKNLSYSDYVWIILYIIIMFNTYQVFLSVLSIIFNTLKYEGKGKARADPSQTPPQEESGFSGGDPSGGDPSGGNHNPKPNNPKPFGYHTHNTDNEQESEKDETVKDKHMTQTPKKKVYKNASEKEKDYKNWPEEEKQKRREFRRKLYANRTDEEKEDDKKRDKKKYEKRKKRLAGEDISEVQEVNKTKKRKFRVRWKELYKPKDKNNDDGEPGPSNRK